MPVHPVLSSHQLVKERNIKHRGFFPPFLILLHLHLLHLAQHPFPLFLPFPPPLFSVTFISHIWWQSSCHFEPGWFDGIRRAVAAVIWWNGSSWHAPWFGEMEMVIWRNHPAAAHCHCSGNHAFTNDRGADSCGYPQWVQSWETNNQNSTKSATKIVVTLNWYNLGKWTTKIVQKSATKIVVTFNGNNLGKWTTKIVPPVFWFQRTCRLVTFLLKSS